jgi:hypothetical protein
MVLWVWAAPNASGWSGGPWKASLLVVMGIAGIAGLVGSLTALKRPAVAVPPLIASGVFGLYWGFPGVLMLLGAALCLWVALQGRSHPPAEAA